MGKTAAEVRLEIERKRADLGTDIDAIEDRVRPSRVARRRTASIRKRWQDARDQVMGRADSGTSSLRDRAGEVQDLATDAPHRVTEAAQGNPLAAGLVAFGFGLLAASLVPATRTEQELTESVRPQLERARDEVTGTAREAAQAVAQELKPEVQQAASDLQDSARDAAQQVQQQVSTS